MVLSMALVHGVLSKSKSNGSASAFKEREVS